MTAILPAQPSRIKRSWSQPKPQHSLSIVMGFTFFLPLLGLIFSFVGLAKEPAGRVYAIVGLLLNGFFIVLWGLFILLALGVFGLVAAPTWSSY